MATLQNSLVLSSGSSLKPLDQGFTKLSFGQCRVSDVQSRTSKRALSIRARYSGERSSPESFIGGFLVGGLIVGTLGCIFAPQITRALLIAEEENQRLLTKLPDFIYDEEKALEKRRRKLGELMSLLDRSLTKEEREFIAQESRYRTPRGRNHVYESA